MLRGRPFTDIDGSPGRDFAIINQRFADMYFPGTNPIGHSIRLTTSGALKTYSGAPAPALTIVGVSPTIRQRNTREPEPDAVVYVPRPSVALTNRATLLVRSARSATETAAVVREEIARLDPDLPIFNVRTLEADLANKRWPLVVIGSTFGLFAAIGLVLSAVSLFGLTSYLVANRTKEIALRMALGAMPSTLLRLLFGRVVAQTLIGITVGILGAYALGRVLQSMLVQTSATDVRVLAGVCLTLVVVAIATCLAPARRAARIEPADVLRTGR
jgi:hypothetical protein